MRVLREFVAAALRADRLDLLGEAAKGVKQAASQGLALAVVADYAFVLYDPKALLDAVTTAVEAQVAAGKKVSLRRTFASFMGSGRVKDFVYGAMLLDDVESGEGACYGAQVPQLVRARSGWGPLLYDIAMASSSAGISAHRTNVSSDAEGVWTYYLRRRPDVKHRAFDDVDDPRTPPADDDCKLYPSSRRALNYAYSLSAAKPDVERLRANHEELLTRLLELNAHNDTGGGFDRGYLNTAFRSVVVPYYGGG